MVLFPLFTSLIPFPGGFFPLLLISSWRTVDVFPMLLLDVSYIVLNTPFLVFPLILVLVLLVLLESSCFRLDKETLVRGHLENRAYIGTIRLKANSLTPDFNFHRRCLSALRSTRNKLGRTSMSSLCLIPGSGAPRMRSP